jgi:hypothetical protein
MVAVNVVVRLDEFGVRLDFSPAAIAHNSESRRSGCTGATSLPYTDKVKPFVFEFLPHKGGIFVVLRCHLSKEWRDLTLFGGFSF